MEHEAGFTSLRSDTERLAAELNLYAYDLEVVEDPFFATALNAEGEIQVADTVYKVTHSWVYQAPITHAARLNSIVLRGDDHVILTQKSEEILGVEAIAVGRPAELRSKRDAVDGGVKEHCIRYWTNEEDARRRLKGKAWMTHYPWYLWATVGIELEYEQKGWFGWSRRKTQGNVLSVDSYVDVEVKKIINKYEEEYTYGDSTWTVEFIEYETIHLNETYIKTKTSASEIRKVFWDDTLFSGVDEITGSIFTHFGIERPTDGSRECWVDITRTK